MTATIHVGLAAGGWLELTLAEQLGNIGTEVARALRTSAHGDVERSRDALDRALELFDLTLADDRWATRRKEIARAREVVCDFLVGDNEFGSSGEALDAYFLGFAMVARRTR
jgi:hypothetical protein